MTQIQATAATNTRLFVRNRQGEEGWSRVLEAVTPETRGFFERDASHEAWIPYEQVLDLLRAVKTQNEGEPDILRSLGMHNSEANLRVTQRIIMKIASVRFVLKMASLLWTGRVKDGGTLGIEKLGRKHVRGALRGFPQPEEEWLEYLVGWFRRTIELSGGRDVEVILEEWGTDPYQTALYDIRWR